MYCWCNRRHTLDFQNENKNVYFLEWPKCSLLFSLVSVTNLICCRLPYLGSVFPEESSLIQFSFLDKSIFPLVRFYLKSYVVKYSQTFSVNNSFIKISMVFNQDSLDTSIGWGSVNLPQSVNLLYFISVN